MKADPLVLKLLHQTDINISLWENSGVIKTNLEKMIKKRQIKNTNT